MVVADRHARSTDVELAHGSHWERLEPVVEHVELGVRYRPADGDRTMRPAARGTAADQTVVSVGP